METNIVEIQMYPDERLNTQNAAIYTGLKEKTLAIKRCNGTGPKFIKRGKIFYYKKDLDDWLNENGKHISTAESV